MKPSTNAKPGTKGKLVGEATRSSQGHPGHPSGHSRMPMRSATSPCSTWPLTASYGAAISSVCGFATSPTETGAFRAMVIQRKRSGPCSSS